MWKWNKISLCRIVGAIQSFLDNLISQCSTRMEIKVLDDGSHYARIHIFDGKWAVQFFTVKSNHERHRNQLKDASIGIGSEDFQDF